MTQDYCCSNKYDDVSDIRCKIIGNFNEIKADLHYNDYTIM